MANLLEKALRIYRSEGLVPLARKAARFLQRATTLAFWRQRLYAAIGPRHGRTAVRDPFVDIRRKLPTESPVIIDGGANEGQVIERFRSSFSTPTIHAFEPHPRLASELQEQYADDPRVTVHREALGPDRRRTEFNIYNEPQLSSCLSENDLETYHDEEGTLEETKPVEQVRLDDHFEDVQIDVCKLNLQGYELEALKGATETLRNTNIVFLRHVGLIPVLYEGEAVFGDIDTFLRNRGFRLFNLYDTYTLDTGQVHWTHALYLNEQRYDEAVP